MEWIGKMNEDLESLGSPLRDLEREFKEKIEPYRSSLWRYCRTLTRSPWDAEDYASPCVFLIAKALSAY
ncbi:DNA-directed RNA polymerase specialized sigma24 family protein [Rossellomorea marisflavi]